MKTMQTLVVPASEVRAGDRLIIGDRHELIAAVTTRMVGGHQFVYIAMPARGEHQYRLRTTTTVTVMREVS